MAKPPVYPPALDRLIKSFAKLPGVGPKSAARLALFLNPAKPALALELAHSLEAAEAEVHYCPVCYNLTDQEICPICQDPDRTDEVICVIAGPADVAAIESAGAYEGRYHVLGGLLNPLEKIGPGQLKIRELLARLEDEAVEEVILATSPTTQGDATANYLISLLNDIDVRVTRIAFGLPVGSDLEYADPVSLKASLNGRRKA